MNLKLSSHGITTQQINITGSKSESNRLLILRALYPNITIENLSNSDDTQVLKQALTQTKGVIDIHHAGTAMRFLTAYYALTPHTNVVLTGSSRMQERPISILVNALRALGCNINYAKQEGYPPLEIQGLSVNTSKVELAANVSSQYISALMLMAPTLKEGLQLILKGKVTSIPYILMTLRLLEQIGVKGSFSNNVISIAPRKTIQSKSIIVESDWSSASYFFSAIVLSNAKQIKLTLRSYKKESLQGDAVLVAIYKAFGIETQFTENSIILQNTLQPLKTHIELDLVNSPDIAQTIAVTCFGLGMSCKLTGLHTLKIKETDRLEALKIELKKLGATIRITQDSLTLKASKKIKENVTIQTYKDHRMAMAFAPLAFKTPICIKDAMVVSKSYPTFWDDMARIGITNQHI